MHALLYLQGEKYFRDWPQQLGSWACENSLPQLHIDMGVQHQLIGLCSKASDYSKYDELDYVACTILM